MVPYRLTLQEHPGYLHAKVEGERTAENALRFFKEVHETCMQKGYVDVLLEMSLTGPSLDTVSVFRVISQRSPPATKFRRMAYIERSESLDKARFAETVAMNRGVNVRLFPDVDTAVAWLSTPASEKSANG